VEGIEDRERAGLVERPAEDIPAQAEREDIQAGVAEQRDPSSLDD
jgi:hypothetical protein